MTEHARDPRPFGGWGVATGALELQVAPRGITAAEARDRRSIVDRLYRYGWAFDERRLEALRACFTKDAVWEGNTAGVDPVAPIRGREPIVEWLSGFWTRQTDQRRHMMVSVLVDNQTPDSADALASLILTSAQDSTVSIVLTSFYRLRMVKQADSWLIAHLFEGFDVAF